MASNAPSHNMIGKSQLIKFSKPIIAFLSADGASYFLAGSFSKERAIK